MRQKQTQFNDSNTGVYPRRTHGLGNYGGDRVVWSVRVDSKLLEEAKPVLKQYFGSTCRAVELWLSALISTEKCSKLSGVYPRNTVEIGKLVIERNIRSRRKMVIEETTEEVITMAKCFVNDCLNEAVTTARYKPEDAEYKICCIHAQEYRRDRRWDVTGRKLGE